MLEILVQMTKICWQSTSLSILPKSKSGLFFVLTYPVSFKDRKNQKKQTITKRLEVFISLLHIGGS